MFSFYGFRDDWDAGLLALGSRVLEGGGCFHLLRPICFIAFVGTEPF